MIKITNTDVVGFENAIRGMRNPMNSWDKSDSKYDIQNCDDCVHKSDYSVCHNSPIYKCFDTKVGDNDLDLMRRLAKAGTDHRKFMRMIVVYADITAPLYWWKEADTYKVGTVRNSCSTMHKIMEKEFTLDDFSHEHLLESGFNNCLLYVIQCLNTWRELYLNTKDKKYWWQIIQILPSSYNQKATLMLNYEVLANMYHSRKSHKLDEWHTFCDWVETLPYSELIIGEVK